MASSVLIRSAAHIAAVTAGLMWQPETGPIAYAIAITVSPNASATGRIPTGNAVPNPPTETAPQPTRTSVAVPRSSHNSLLSLRYFITASHDDSRLERMPHITRPRKSQDAVSQLRKIASRRDLDQSAVPKTCFDVPTAEKQQRSTWCGERCRSTGVCGITCPGRAVQIDRPSFLFFLYQCDHPGETAGRIFHFRSADHQGRARLRDLVEIGDVFEPPATRRQPQLVGLEVSRWAIVERHGVNRKASHLALLHQPGGGFRSEARKVESAVDISPGKARRICGRKLAPARMQCDAAPRGQPPVFAFPFGEILTR